MSTIVSPTPYIPTPSASAIRRMKSRMNTQPLYAIPDDPLPCWRKEIITPGYSKHIGWNSKTYTRYISPNKSNVLICKEDVIKYFTHHDKNMLESALSLFDFREVFCVCHKPEICEVVTYMECMANIAGCNRWFHPECAGWDRYELDLYEDDLICPLCTEYIEKNSNANKFVEDKLLRAYHQNPVKKMKPFRLIRLKGNGLFYITDQRGLPKLEDRIILKTQIDQQTPKIVQQENLEILSFTQPHRVWGIGSGRYSYTEKDLTVYNVNSLPLSPPLPISSTISSTSIPEIKIENSSKEQDTKSLIHIKKENETKNSSNNIKNDKKSENSKSSKRLSSEILDQSSENKLNESNKKMSVENSSSSSSLEPIVGGIPWINGTPPQLPIIKKKQDIRIATKKNEFDKKSSYVYVSIRSGWKKLSTENILTHEDRMKLSLQSTIPMDIRFQMDLIKNTKESMKTVKYHLFQQQNTSTTSVVNHIDITPTPSFSNFIPLSDGSLVTATLLPGTLPDLHIYCNDHCVFCFENINPIQSNNSTNTTTDTTTTTTTILKSGNHSYTIHTICSNILRENLFQSILDSTTPKNMIKLKGLISSSSSACCLICGRIGSIMYKFSLHVALQLLDDEKVYSGHPFCLRMLSISGLLNLKVIPSISNSLNDFLNKYTCSLCGNNCGITFSCAESTCHRHAHHICALQGGWTIGVYDQIGESYPYILCNLHSLCNVIV